MITEVEASAVEVPAVAGEVRAWLTSVLRPAGTLDADAVGRLAEALTTLAASSDMVVVDLSAASASSASALAAALRAPAEQLSRRGGRGGCLLLVGPGPDLVAELQRGGVPAATVAAPGQAAAGGPPGSSVAGVGASRKASTIDTSQSARYGSPTCVVGGFDADAVQPPSLCARFITSSPSRTREAACGLAGDNYSSS